MQSIKKITAVIIAVLLFASAMTGCAKEENTKITATATTEKTTNVGDIVKFGRYEQDNNTANGKETIAWQVLAAQDGKALLISEKVFAVKPYNQKAKDVTWETCTLRGWLNEAFLNSAFTAQEKSRMLTTKLPNKTNAQYGTPGGKMTNDKVFLLSFEEAGKYFSVDKDRTAEGTAYSLKTGLFALSSAADTTGNGYWWLRSPGHSADSARYINSDGTVGDSKVTSPFIGVRPAVWITLQF